tara:strand:+ start:136 stop:945 length:810 start_codon:yes stop_codon:yes gene_type:complete
MTSNKEFRTYAFEGLNASGKSTVIKFLSKKFSEENYKVGVYKISGLGNGPKMNKLRDILHYRETLLRENKLDERQESDFLRDRIFRIATRQQIKDYKKSNPSKNFDISLLDRTPLMSWAYSSSINRTNPYLEEILEESLRLTGELSINTLFLFDLDPITMYTRIINRNLKKDEPIEYQTSKLLKLIKAPKQITNKIKDLTISTFENNPDIEPKSFHIWDYMPYDEVCKQLENYRKVTDMAEEIMGLRKVIIDATKNIEEVLGRIQSYLK